jgi:uncharacterized protein (TIGR03663 family)
MPLLQKALIPLSLLLVTAILVSWSITPSPIGLTILLPGFLLFSKLYWETLQSVSTFPHGRDIDLTAENPLLKMLKTHGIPISILLLAATLRLYQLDEKPLHFDEGINGNFVTNIKKDGYYPFNPSNYHGPLHFYALFWTMELLGESEWTLRLPTTLASILCVGVLFLFAPYFGKRQTNLAALFAALSPAYIFYGRYAIHETWLALFLTIFFLGILILWKKGNLSGLILTFTGITGCILTKETYIIHFGSFLLAVPLYWAYTKYKPTKEPLPMAKQTWTKKNLFVTLLGSCGAILYFYSGGFLEFSMLPGLFSKLWAWKEIGISEQPGHHKPFFYWLTLITKYEWMGLLGLITSPLVLTKQASGPQRLLAIWGVGCFAAYSIVPYKTPWCLISMLWPLILLGACACVELFDRFNKKTIQTKQASQEKKTRRKKPNNKKTTKTHLQVLQYIIPTAIVTAAGYTSWMSVDLNYLEYDNHIKHPYVYVQMHRDTKRITDPIQKANKARGFDLPGLYIQNPKTDGLWPIPYLIGHRVAWVNAAEGEPPQPIYPPSDGFTITSPLYADAVESALRQKHYKIQTTDLTGYNPLTAYLNKSLFQDFVPKDTPVFVPSINTPSNQTFLKLLSQPSEKKIPALIDAFNLTNFPKTFYGIILTFSYPNSPNIQITNMSAKEISPPHSLNSFLNTLFSDLASKSPKNNPSQIKIHFIITAPIPLNPKSPYQSPHGLLIQNQNGDKKGFLPEETLEETKALFEKALEETNPETTVLQFRLQSFLGKDGMWKNIPENDESQP